MCSPKILLLVFVVACIFFFTTAHFHPAGLSLLTASISHFLTAAMKFSCFFFFCNKIRHLFFRGGPFGFDGAGCRIFRLLDIFFIAPALQDFFFNLPVLA